MLFLELLQKMSLIALAAYIYNQSNFFNNLIKKNLNTSDKIISIIFFSILSILGTYLGINVEPGALANTRPIGAIAAGYVGGPLIGVIVGLIAGFHRYTMGGFTALACGLSTIAEGLVGGLIGKYVTKGKLTIPGSIYAGIIAEMLQVVIIVLLSKPYRDAIALEKVIAIPMMLVNTLGVVIFINIIKSAREGYNKLCEIQAQRILNISKCTITYMKKGYNKNTAEAIAKIIYEIGNIDGVFLSDKNELLSYFGSSVDINNLTKYVIDNNRNTYCHKISFLSFNKINYFYCIPLIIEDNSFEGILGIKVEYITEIDKNFIEFSQELGGLLSTQIEYYKLTKIAQEANTAELKALRAQIHPHFLFNALNTIASFCRSNPSKARDLIIELSNYFRKTLTRNDNFVQLKEELELIESYITIEKARFGERLQYSFNVPPDCFHFKVPIFILQPLIENSIKHGILPKIDGGNVYLNAAYENNGIKFIIEDDGVGMNKSKLKEIITTCPGIGLKNVNDRLKILYGEKYKLNIKSTEGIGTKITFFIPGGTIDE